MTLRILIGLGAGAALGFAYHKVLGCPSGGCPITANPWISTAYGAVLGLLFSSGGG